MGIPSRLKVVGSIPPADQASGERHAPPDAGARSGSDRLDGWVLATAPRVTAYAASLLRDREKAEDIVQDCYCRLLEKADVYDLERDGLKLLLKAVSNACINLQTRHRWLTSLFRADGQPREIPDVRTPDPGEGLLERELAEAVSHGLARLPIRQRAAIELKSQGHTLQEVADILGVTATNAGVLIHRARASMETYLAPYREGQGP